jgi:hypothetical protein
MVALRASALARIFMDFSLKALLDIFGFAGFLPAVFFGVDFFAAAVLAAGLFAREDTRVAAPGFVAGLAARVVGIISKTQFSSFQDAPLGADPESSNRLCFRVLATTRAPQ